MERFAEAVSRYLLAADSPAAREVGRRLAGCSGKGLVPGPERAPALAHLAAALAASDAHALVELLTGIADDLPWTEGPFAMPDSFAGRYAFAELAGPEGPLTHAGLRFGLYLQSPETIYPSHSHAAEELYLVLAGAAQWQAGDAPFATRYSGSLIHHPSRTPHAMTTGPAPLLAVWAWIGDLDPGTYHIAGDA